MYIGAFDIGGTKTIIALADENGKIYEKNQFVSDTKDCLRHLDHCCEEFRKILKNQGIDTDAVSAIGVNLPGIVNRKTGVLECAVFAGWYDIPVKEYLANSLQIEKIICENDVNSCAEGELRFGLGDRYQSFGWMTVSTGVGGAVVCDGKLIRGAHGFAGEFGHMKVEYEQAKQCPCGEYGCLEAHGSGTGLGRMISEHVANDPAFAAAFEKIGKEATGASCAELARNGNQTAIDIFESLGEYLGRGISYYANILDPEAVVIGGGVAASIDLILPGIRRAIERYTFEPMKQIEVVTTALGYEAALVGAIAIATTALERE